MKKFSLFLLACILINTAKAYRIEWGRNVTISIPVHEDLYVAGGTVTINAPVYGDVIVAAGTVYIKDTISNDLLLAGGTVYMSSYIGDDVRCAGGQLHISKSIGGDLVITGGTVEIAKGVLVGGGLICSGGDITVNGAINNDVKVAAGNFVFNGIANKNFDCRAEAITMNGSVNGTSVLAAKEIAIGDNAAFNNSIRYWNQKGKLDFRQSIKYGNAAYDKTLKVKTNNWYFLGHASIAGLVWYLINVFLFIALIQYLFGNTFKKAGHTTGSSLLKSLGYGFLFFIGVPVAVVLLLVTIVGIPFGLILMMSYILLVVLATVITSLVFANWYSDRFGYKWKFWQIVFSAMAMFVLFKLISFTPFFGWSLMIIIACIAFGSLLRNIAWRKKQPVAVQ